MSNFGCDRAPLGLSEWIIFRLVRSCSAIPLQSMGAFPDRAYRESSAQSVSRATTFEQGKRADFLSRKA
jgi:hypothetical protein